MAEVEEECIFETKVDQVHFSTVTNGDKLNMKKLRLTQDQATSLAWLVNHSAVLEWSVKVKAE